MRKLGFVFWAAQILMIFLVWSRLPPELPLFYSRPWGKEQLTNPAGLWLLPGLSGLVFLVNLFFLLFVPKEEKLMQQTLTASSMLFNLLCLVTLIQIIKLVV